MYKFDSEIKRVAAYCRVSTDSLDQANSLESQQRYFNDYIKRNPLWELSKIYVDEGISGTSTKKRNAFNQMIEDAKRGNFDIIITKEISRFARNTLDSIGYTRELKRLGIGVIFMNDNINTLDPDAELRLTIMSSIAQEESRKTSERVKWGQRRMMEQGKVFGRDMLGYDVRDGKLIINEEGAKTVRLIFHKFFVEGKGTHLIAKELQEEGIRTSTYMKKWSYTVILRVLKNEKYCGDLIQQKTYTPDYLSHSKKKNEGQLEFVVIRDHHEPIISREMFEATQLEIERRRKKSTPNQAGFANRYMLSGKIKCAECGSTFTRTTKYIKNGKKTNKWVCIESQKNGSKRKDKNGETIGCTTNSISEKDITDILNRIMTDVLKSREKVIKKVLKTVKAVLDSEPSNDNIAYYEKELTKTEKKKQKLLDMCLSGDIETEEYKKGCERLNAEYEALTERLKKEKIHNQNVADKGRILKDIEKHLRQIMDGSVSDEAFMREMIDKIVVYKGRKMDIHLKSIPSVWTARILAGSSEIEAYNQKKSNESSSVPISVSKPLSSLYGIEKRCER